jgi:hypothetical protein
VLVADELTALGSVAPDLEAQALALFRSDTNPYPMDDILMPAALLLADLEKPPAARHRDNRRRSSSSSSTHRRAAGATAGLAAPIRDPLQLQPLPQSIPLSGLTYGAALAPQGGTERPRPRGT